MLMHYHALFLSSLSFLSTISYCVICLLFSIVSLTWLPRNLLLRRTRYLIVVLHLLLLFLLFLLEIGFDENFFGQVIHSERQVILSNFSNMPLPSAFKSRGWVYLCEKPTRCPSVFIQELYSNIHAINISTPQFTIFFQGKCIVVNSKLISKVLHVPKVAHPDYPSHPHLCSISQDKLASHFYEKAMGWGEREKVIESLWAFFFPYFGRTFPLRGPLIRWWRGETWNRSNLKGTWRPWEDLQEEKKRIETDFGFQTKAYYCFVKWLTTCSNLDEYALKLHSDDRNAASFVKTFCFCPSCS